MQEVLKKGKFLFFLIILFFATNSCDKIQDSQIPNIPFSFTINLTIANDLTIPGNSLFFPGGYGGVIVYCADIDEYYAFDAACTYEIDQTCKVVNSFNVGECSCCESKYLFIAGGANPAKGPAAAPLRQYYVSRMNNVTLRVYNP